MTGGARGIGWPGTLNVYVVCDVATGPRVLGFSVALITHAALTAREATSSR